VTRVSWSTLDGEECLRLADAPRAGPVHVRPPATVADAGLPSMAGRLVRDGDDVCFVPRYPFVDGTTYAVDVGGVTVGSLVRPRRGRPPTTEVVAILPTATTVPRNLLRLYVVFSAPMSEGRAARHVRLVDESGAALAGALLATQYELWDADRRRLTILLDPARIKRGLVPQRQTGYPLRTGIPCTLEVDGGLLDAQGSPLSAGSRRRYEVGPDERRHVDPGDWVVSSPAVGTVEPLEVVFDRPLDHGLLARCLRVVGPAGRRIGGTPAIGPGERSWRLAPVEPWVSGPYRLVVDPVLEDLAGNSVERVFDRDLRLGRDEPRGSRPVVVTFTPH
jgi:hypothetical protein